LGLARNFHLGHDRIISWVITIHVGNKKFSSTEFYFFHTHNNFSSKPISISTHELTPNRPLFWDDSRAWAWFYSFHLFFLRSGLLHSPAYLHSLDLFEISIERDEGPDLFLIQILTHHHWTPVRLLLDSNRWLQDTRRCIIICITEFFDILYQVLRFVLGSWSSDSGDWSEIGRRRQDRHSVRSLVMLPD
jgi:hypothetical protein